MHSHNETPHLACADCAMEIARFREASAAIARMPREDAAALLATLTTLRSVGLIGTLGVYLSLMPQQTVLALLPFLASMQRAVVASPHAEATAVHGTGRADTRPAAGRLPATWDFLGDGGSGDERRARARSRHARRPAR